MKTKIISAFPACGKSTYYKEWSQFSKENVWRIKNNGEQVFNNIGDPCGEKILDSDSSLFSWVYKDGVKTDIRNPNFPQNYIDHTKENIGKVDIIFVSSHDIVRKALKENNIHYTLIYPEREMKKEFMLRFENRKNDDKFIKFLNDNWDKFIDEMESETFPDKFILRPYVNMEYITVSIMNKIMDYEEC